MKEGRKVGKKEEREEWMSEWANEWMKEGRKEEREWFICEMTHASLFSAIICLHVCVRILYVYVFFWNMEKMEKMYYKFTILTFLTVPMS